MATRAEGECTIMRVDGEIDVYTGPQLREALVDLIEHTGRYRLVIDLDDVDFLDSTGLAVLVSALKRVRAHEGSLSLVCANDPVLRILRVTGLSKVFPVYDSVAEALAEVEEDQHGPLTRA